MHWGFGGLEMMFMMGLSSVLLLILLAGLAVLVYFLARHAPGGSASISGSPTHPGEHTAREILKMRYVRGEITREEFETILEDIEP